MAFRGGGVGISSLSLLDLSILDNGLKSCVLTRVHIFKGLMFRFWLYRVG